MESTAAVIAHYENEYIKYLVQWKGVENGLGSKQTKERRAELQDQKCRLKLYGEELRTILPSLYTLTKASVMEVSPYHWREVLQKRMEREKAAAELERYRDWKAEAAAEEEAAVAAAAASQRARTAAAREELEARLVAAAAV